MPVIALRTGGWVDEMLADAVEIFDDPHDLLARYDESLLGGGAPLPRRFRRDTAHQVG